jgi:hypothetical protein
LQAVRSVGSAQFAGLHYKCEQACGQAQEKNRIAEPAAEA